jgi:diguanylate cyclase (GGDEF)-like protein
MSLVIARKKRTQLFGAIVGLLLIVGLVSLISVEDPSGATVRIGIVMITLGAGLWMERSWELIPVALLAWLGPNFARSLFDDSYQLFSTTMMLEAVGVLAIAGVASMTREALKALETENLLIGSNAPGAIGINPDSGVFQANQLRTLLEVELARSRRFGREFSLVLVGIDELRQKYDYRDPGVWQASLAATARLLRNTRHNVDRVFHYGDDGFALILPEASEKDVVGMVRRLRRLARAAFPAEGEPGGPLPAHYGATFYPTCATTVEDLMRRAEIALRIAEKSTLRYQLDSAAAPELPAAETMRRPDLEVVASDIADADEPATAIAELAVEKPISAVLVEAEEIAASLEVRLDEEPAVSESATDVETTVAYEEAAAEAEANKETVAEQQTVVAAMLTPAGEPIAKLLDEAAVTMDDPAIAADLIRAADSFDEIDGILRQMDETLTLIRKVRSAVA